ncbi:ATP-binding protein [Kitasatospora sp. NPDC090091]|uniref:ATP-binding protein n=1 Tax=Kitasatospora sp. NPDC090091 TaxID=3364081 RepID=UPI0037F5DC0D
MTFPRQRGITEQAATAAIDQACRMLRLPTVRSQFPELAESAAREQMSYLGFLSELLMSECDDRARRRSERRIKAAGFPRDKSLRKFDFDANPNIDPAAIHTLATCEWIKKSLPLCLIGDSGTGKSHLLIALGTEAAMAGFRVKYVLATKLVNELVEAADEKQLAKTIARYGRVDLLCIDLCRDRDYAEGALEVGVLMLRMQVPRRHSPESGRTHQRRGRPRCGGGSRARRGRDASRTASGLLRGRR